MARGRRRLQGWGCVWVCPGRARGVLREGLAEGAGPRAPQPRAKGVEGRRMQGGEVGRRPSGPGAGGHRDAARERQVWANGAGMRGCGARAHSGSSTYLRGWKWAGMGRNTVPEVKPPAPSSRAGDVPEGNQSPSPAPPPALSLHEPPPLSLDCSRRRRAGLPCPRQLRPPGSQGRGQREIFEGVKEVGPEEESEGV